MNFFARVPVLGEGAAKDPLYPLNDKSCRVMVVLGLKTNR
jgi:hypothetical protein